MDLGASWAPRPNSEDRINRIPHDQILHHVTENIENHGAEFNYRTKFRHEWKY